MNRLGSLIPRALNYKYDAASAKVLGGATLRKQATHMRVTSSRAPNKALRHTLVNISPKLA